jgi:hypothetical protein
MNVHPINTAVAVSALQQPVLHRDYEVRSTLLLPKVGAWKFAAAKETEVLCCAFAVNDGPVQIWLPGNLVPPEFVEASQCAHNAQFEAAIEQLIMQRRFGWPEIPSSQHRCTMVMGLMQSSCQSLSSCGINGCSCR